MDLCEVLGLTLLLVCRNLLQAWNFFDWSPPCLRRLECFIYLMSYLVIHENISLFIFIVLQQYVMEKTLPIFQTLRQGLVICLLLVNVSQSFADMFVISASKLE